MNMNDYTKGNPTDFVPVSTLGVDKDGSPREFFSPSQGVFLGNIHPDALVEKYRNEMTPSKIKMLSQELNLMRMAYAQNRVDDIMSGKNKTGTLRDVLQNGDEVSLRNSANTVNGGNFDASAQSAFLEKAKQYSGNWR